MKLYICKSLWFAVLGSVYAFYAHAATSLFSDYGQIQNVQNYSSNPFWKPGSPYNQRLPQPVYVQGTDVTTDDCNKVVGSLVAVQCMARNNCKNTSLAEIRPEIMVQLSKLPGNNYVTSCSGFIDSIFESYIKQYANELPGGKVKFPTATVSNTNTNDNTVQINNPYKQTPTKWQQEIKDRKNELQQLQKQNGAGTEHLSATQFPTTYEDLSFTERMQIQAEGYAPYAGKSAYVIPDFQNKDEWCKGEGKDTSLCKEPEDNVEDDVVKKTGKKTKKKSLWDQTLEYAKSAEDCTEEIKSTATEEQKALIKTAFRPAGSTTCFITECNKIGSKEYKPSKDFKSCVEDYVKIDKNFKVGILFAKTNEFEPNDIITPNNQALGKDFFANACSTQDAVGWIDDNNPINSSSSQAFNDLPVFQSDSDFFIDNSLASSHKTHIFPGLLILTNASGDPAYSGKSHQSFIVMYNSSEIDTIITKINSLKTNIQNKSGNPCKGLSIYLVAIEVGEDNNIKESPVLDNSNFKKLAAFKNYAHYNTTTMIIDTDKSEIKRLKILTNPIEIQ